MERDRRTIVIGIDPGVSGAVGILDEASGEAIGVWDMPTMAAGTSRLQINASALASTLKFHSDRACVRVVVIEKVNAMPKNGSIASFSLGRSMGMIEGVCASLGLPITLVPPQQWKRAFGLSADKQHSRTYAQRLYPTAELHLKKHHGRAEALLLARYYLESWRSSWKTD